MDNVLIDDRRIHVDFSQSVAKVQMQKQGNFFIKSSAFLVKWQYWNVKMQLCNPECILLFNSLTSKNDQKLISPHV